jgi:hypothetical protein
MANHFRAIGLPIDSDASLMALVERVAPTADAVEVEGGVYLLWRSDLLCRGDVGGELWLQVVGDGLVGLNPHFVGPARLYANILHRVEYEDDSELDGAWYAWANPSEEEGDYPFVFSAPDARRLDDLQLPLRCWLQIAVFAHELAVAPTYDALPSLAEEMQMAARSAIPVGLFQEDDAPRPLVMYVGEVLAAQRLEEDGGVFVHLHLVTLGGEVDVVASAELLAEAPAPGSAVRVLGWVSARLIRDDEDGVA